MSVARVLGVGAVVVVTVGLAFLRPRGLESAALPERAEAKPRASESGGLSISFGDAGRRVDVQEATKGRVAETVSAPGTLRPGSEVTVGAPFDGRIEKLIVDEGDTVKEGDPVFELDPVEWKEKVHEAELELSRRKAALEESEADDREAERKAEDARKEPSALTEARLRKRQSELGAERAKAQLEAADARLALARAKLEMNVGSRVDVDAADTERRVSEIGRRVADEELRLAVETEVFRERSWKDDRLAAEKGLEVGKKRLERARADLTASQVGLERARRDLERTKIRSPLAGIVTLRQVNKGELVGRGGSTIESAHYVVSDMAHMLAYCDVEEGDVTKVAPGQPARVRVNALGDDVRLKGKVLDVANRAGRKDDVATFRVRVLITVEGDAEAEKQLAKLRPSMSASVEIETRAKEDCIRVPPTAVLRRKKKDLPDAAWTAIDAKAREAKKPDDLQDVLFAHKDGKVAIRAVVVGVSDGERLEIEKGLAFAEQVVVGPYRTLELLSDGETVRANVVTEKDGGKPAEGSKGTGK